MDDEAPHDLKFVRGSETSLLAALEAEPLASTQRARVYAELFHYSQGLTDHEMQVQLDMNPSTQRPRRIELVEAGLVVKSGLYRPTPSGRLAVVWILKSKEQLMSTHSAILGGSNAARLIACPASYQEQLKAPVEDVSSPYAERGTRLHVGVAYAVTWKISPAKLRKGFDWSVYDLDIDDDENEVLARALDLLEDLKRRYGGGFRVLAIEETLPLPGVSGAFGSVDLLLYNKATIIVLDWKFGQGVVVPVLKDMGDGNEQLNAQLAFYALCARGKYPRYFKGRRVVVAIVQPSVEVPLSETETSNDELDEYDAAFVHAYNEALGRDPHMERGDHCKFARCKGTCPLWTGPVFDLVDINPAAAQLEASQSEAATRGYGPYLSHALELAAFAEEWVTEIRRQAHVYLENGGPVPGWKLVPKRGQRQWLNLEDAHNTLTLRGADHDDIYTQPELKSVAQAEKALKPRGIAVPGELYHTVSSGATIARSDDARPAANPPEVVIALGEALKLIN